MDTLMGENALTTLSIIRGTILAIGGIVILNIILMDHFTLPIGIYEKASIYFFYNFAGLTFFIGTIVMINPVIGSRIVLGFFGDELKSLEYQLAWEVSITAGFFFLFLLSIAYIFQILVEFNHIAVMTVVLAVLLGIICFSQFLLTLRVDSILKKVHNQLIYQIRPEEDNPLSHDEFIGHLSKLLQERGQLDSVLEDMDSAKLEESLSSRFSIFRVIPYLVLSGLLAVILMCIMLSYAFSYSLLSLDLLDNFRVARNMGATLTAALLLTFSLILHLRKESLSFSYVKSNPTHTLRPGQLDRIYLQFFPYESDRVKIETVFTILSQGVLLCLSMGLAFLLYGTILQSLIYLGVEDDLLELVNAIILFMGMLILSIIIVLISRRGTRIWIASVEFGLAKIDIQLKKSLAVTKEELISYIQTAKTVISLGEFENGNR
ncbi:MAG: hypothetical protein ACXACI_06605 [Candidatus Hodarchaeales archaeon]|jgi:hypothetical protein